MILAYVAPVAALAVLLVSGRGRSRAVATWVLLALPVFYALHYVMLQRLQGWPSDAVLPDTFELLAFVVSEPGDTPTRDGEIVLWIRTPANPTPRAHRLAYRRTLHQSLAEAGKRLALGRPQQGQRADPAAGPEAPAKHADDSGAIRFSDAPPHARLPEKPTAK